MSLLSRVVGIAAAVALCSSGSVAQSPQPDFAIPTWSGAYQPQGVDERGLWMVDDESERLLRDSRLIIDDPALNGYVRDVLCRTVGTERCGSVRLYILRVPAFNATMSPNGTMRVYSGLLLRVRNEAELASVLGHEFAHFELRHSLDDFKRARRGSDILAWAAVLGAMASTYGGGRTTYGDPRVSVYGALARYNRDQERSADVLGFAYMSTAAYRASAAADVWRSNMNEVDATATGRLQRSPRYDSNAFFSTHPTNLERADYLAALANRVSGGDYDGRDTHRAAMAPWMDAFLDDQIRLNDFGGSEYLLNRLAAEEWTGSLLYARGELYRMRGNPRDLVQAGGFYRRALQAEPQRTLAHRGLGLALLRSGFQAEGRQSLTEYLAAHPDASDAAMLRGLASPQ